MSNTMREKVAMMSMMASSIAWPFEKPSGGRQTYSQQRHRTKKGPGRSKGWMADLKRYEDEPTRYCTVAGRRRNCRKLFGTKR